MFQFLLSMAMDILHVVWDDSCHACGWQSKEEFTDFIKNTEAIDSIGFLVHESQTHLVLAQSIGRGVGDLIKIPKSEIKSREVLKQIDITLED